MTTNRTVYSTSTRDFNYPTNIETYWQSALHYDWSTTTNTTTNTSNAWVRRDHEKIIEHLKKNLEREITEDDVIKLLKDDD